MTVFPEDPIRLLEISELLIVTHDARAKRRIADHGQTPGSHELVECRGARIEDLGVSDQDEPVANLGVPIERERSRCEGWLRGETALRHLRPGCVQQVSDGRHPRLCAGHSLTQIDHGLVGIDEHGLEQVALQRSVGLSLPPVVDGQCDQHTDDDDYELR